jgi:opacity protein-like surface antigen
MFSKSSVVTATSAIFTATFVLLSVGGASASEQKNNYVGPTIGFSSGTTLYGVVSKFKVADSFSLRPFIQFASASSGPSSATVTIYGASATYDFNLPNSGFNPYAGVGYAGGSVSYNTPGSSGSFNLGSGIYFEAGADYHATDSIAINANYKFKDGGYLSIGGGYRF